jgi:SAM-dependent methyltransferase
MALNPYFDEERLRRDVDAGRHREIIGGLLDELGQLQLDFLKARGLQPDQRLLDIGCGSGRFAVKAIPYLHPHRYFGIDISRSLLTAAWQEVEASGCVGKVSIQTFHATKDFTPLAETGPFDFGIAQSVFTHQPLDQLPICLNAIRSHFEHSRLFATFFVAPPGVVQVRHDPGGVITFADRDPFHFSVDDIVAVARRAGWSANWIGAWGHPRDQHMCELWPGR